MHTYNFETLNSVLGEEKWEYGSLRIGNKKYEQNPTAWENYPNLRMD